MSDVDVVGFVVVKEDEAFPVLAHLVLHFKLAEELAEHPGALWPFHGHPDPRDGNHVAGQVAILHHLRQQRRLLLPFDQDQGYVRILQTLLHPGFVQAAKGFAGGRTIFDAHHFRGLDPAISVAVPEDGAGLQRFHHHLHGGLF